MKFSEILDQNEDGVILRRMNELYPRTKNSEKGYGSVLEELRSMTPVDSTPYSLRVVFEAPHPDDVLEEGYFSVTGVIEGDSESYAMEYTDWSEWLALPFAEDDLKEWGALDCLVHALWEMTWAGFSNADVAQKLAELNERYGDAEIDEAVPSDEVLVELLDKLSQE